MAFDPQHLDRAQAHHSAGDAVYGDDWGDRSPSCLLDAWEASQARRWADAPADALQRLQAAAFVARNEQRAARRQSAKAERAILREQRLQARQDAEAGRLSPFGSALAAALSHELGLAVAFPARQEPAPAVEKAHIRSNSRLKACL